ncbi:MAG: hypothetical protein AB1589_16055 [Cyanobacteriota bacterium]
MIALQEASTTQKRKFNDQSYSGILSEKSAIVLCGLGVAIFAVPILVVIQIISGFYWGGVSVYQLLSGSDIDKLENL